MRTEVRNGWRCWRGAGEAYAVVRRLGRPEPRLGAYGNGFSVRWGVLRPGDVLYLPAGWWHHVRTLEMSITLNFWWWTWRGVGVAARAAFYQAAIAKNKLQRGEPADDPVSMPTD